jgi:hypothetical protein
MRWPTDACFDPAARGTAKSRQPHRYLTEKRRDRVVAAILRLANPIAAGANWPPDRVLPRLRGGDLALNPREQLFRFREGQSQIGDIAEIIRLADLHNVHAGTLAPAATNFKIHSTPHPRSRNRSENTRQALAPPGLHRSLPGMGHLCGNALLLIRFVILQTMQIIHRALRMRGRGENETLVALHYGKPFRDRSRVLNANHRSYI